jgi:hypothetical protein
MPQFGFKSRIPQPGKTVTGNAVHAPGEYLATWQIFAGLGTAKSVTVLMYADLR